MTNFFDIATPHEVAEQFASDGVTPLDADEATFSKALLEQDKDHNLVCLGFLFLSRGDKKQAEEYFAQIQSPERKLEVGMLLGELVEA